MYKRQAESESDSLATVQSEPQPIVATEGTQPLPMNQLVELVEPQLDRWYKITVTPAANQRSPAQLVIAYTKAIQATQQETWQINPYTGAVISKTGWSDLSTQAQAGQVVRRLHTGELYGIAGQTIAGIVSLIACIMVWTGIALAWRRLIPPLFAKAK